MAKKKIVSLDQKLKRVKISDFELDSPVVFEYFDGLPANERDEKLERSIYIGVLALMEDRLSAFLAKTQNELGTELESLKKIFDLKSEIFMRSAVKGMAAEEEIVAFLNEYFESKKMEDKAEGTGTTEGKLKGNKTGDIVCFVGGDDEKRIVIEVKFDKSLGLGDISDKDVFTKTKDTAWSQIIESRVNREGKVGVIVFDKAMVSSSILNLTDNVAFIKGVGFICVVDSQSGDFSNLVIAYHLARDIVLSTRSIDFDDSTLTIILKRVIKDIESTLKIKEMVQKNIDINQDILKELEKSYLLIEFSNKYLHKFLKDGKLSKKDLLDFYNGEEIKDKFAPIEKEIEKLTN